MIEMRPIVMQRLLEQKPQRIIYVSCELCTLDGNLGVLTQRGYDESMKLVDMFPWT